MRFSVADASNYEKQIKKQDAENLIKRIENKLEIFKFAIEREEYDELEETCNTLRTLLGGLKL